MSRCDDVVQAAIDALERQRKLLDADVPMESISLIVFLAPDGKIAKSIFRVESISEPVRKSRVR